MPYFNAFMEDIMSKLATEDEEEKIDDEFFELFHDFKRYVVKSSELRGNWDKKVIVLPDGTILEARQIYPDYTNKHGSRLKVPCLKGNNWEFRTWSRLPVLNRVEAKEQKE